MSFTDFWTGRKGDAPLYRDYMRAFHFSILTLTLIFATYSAGTLATLLFLGRLSAQIGRRRIPVLASA